MAAASGELGRGRPGAPVRLGGRHGQGGEALLYKVSSFCSSFRICFCTIGRTHSRSLSAAGNWDSERVRWHFQGEEPKFGLTSLSFRRCELIYFTSGKSFRGYSLLDLNIQRRVKHVGIMVVPGTDVCNACN